MPIGILNSGLVPTRFLCILSHLVIVITIFMNRGEHVNLCDTSTDTTTSYDNQFIVALSLSIAFSLFELASFVSGITLFNSFQCFISTILHSSASISLSFMLFNRWCSTYYWPVFAICSCLPLITESVYLFGIIILRRSIS